MSTNGFINPNFLDRAYEPIEQRRQRQATESREAWREYQLQQMAIRDRMAQQRAARLARGRIPADQLPFGGKQAAL